MILLTKYSFLALLFLLGWLFFNSVFNALLLRSKTKSRLNYAKQVSALWKFPSAKTANHVFFRHITDLLEAVRMPLSLHGFMILTVFLLLIGVLSGSLWFSGLKGIVALSVMLGSLPYIYVRMKLLRLQTSTRLNLLPAVEIFYQDYLLSDHKNMRSVLQKSLEGKRMLYPMKSVFEQLHHHLMVQQDMESGLRIFSMALGNIWANYFMNIFRFGLLEGIDVTENLSELIQDMRKAQRDDQQDRNRLLEIRIANFSPLLFLGVFLLINFKLNFHSAYYYYLETESGRGMLLDALILIFISFLMGIYLSVKRM